MTEGFQGSFAIGMVDDNGLYGNDEVIIPDSSRPRMRRAPVITTLVSLLHDTEFARHFYTVLSRDKPCTV